MKKYSIGYKDSYGSFNKIWENGKTKLFDSIKDCKNYIKLLPTNTYKIMCGWQIIEIVNHREVKL